MRRTPADPWRDQRGEDQSPRWSLEVPASADCRGPLAVYREVRKRPDELGRSEYNGVVTLDGATLYRALSARDRRFDGLFFVGVASTGVYCRPVCPARTPRS